MKNEAELCTVIKKSLVDGYKIPDESGFQTGAHSSIRCFDGIGMLSADKFGGSNNDLNFICWEAKLMKNPGAFSFKRLQPWQNEYLSKYAKARDVRSLVIVGVDYGRADKRVFVFRWDDNFSDLYNIGFSIHLKELNKLPYNSISKGVFEFANIINYNDLVGIYDDFNKVYNTFKAKSEEVNNG